MREREEQHKRNCFDCINASFSDVSDSEDERDILTEGDLKCTKKSAASDSRHTKRGR